MTTPTADSMGADPGLRRAAERLVRLGFVVVSGSHPEDTGAAQLLVALRARPTLEHFDPELVEHWAISAGRGRLVEISRATPLPRRGPYSWGTIRAVDRVDAFNSFLSFGGEVTVAALDADLTMVVFDSPAPIVRSTGHSQGVDPLTGEVGAFFARIKVPIDFVPGAEAIVSKAAPRTLYCAFIQHVRERLAQAQSLRDANRWLTEWSSRESQRMEASANDHWKAAIELRRQLGAIEAIARE
jgi:hypothetical protein